MRPICAVFRRTEQGALKKVSISEAEYGKTEARSYISDVLSKADKEMKTPGVYRLKVTPENEGYSVTKIADSRETIAVVFLTRDNKDSCSIRDVRLSSGAGVKHDEKQLREYIKEGIDSCIEQIPIAQERAVEIIIPQKEESEFGLIA